MTQTPPRPHLQLCVGGGGEWDPSSLMAALVQCSGPKSQECGNGIIEGDEECDCGHLEDQEKCDEVDPCCNTNCTLKAGVKCRWAIVLPISSNPASYSSSWLLWSMNVWSEAKYALPGFVLWPLPGFVILNITWEKWKAVSGNEVPYSLSVFKHLCQNLRYYHSVI